MELLTATDYEQLDGAGLDSVEESGRRFLILKDYQLPVGIYNVSKCNILVEIPSNYPDAGNDMFWVHPELFRSNGKAIPAAARFGGGDPRHHDDKEYCRWSRHWNTVQRWDPAKDRIKTILNRITWCLLKPDCK